jgi:hypothetical protein
MSQESGLRQTCFTLVEGCVECVGPGDIMGTLDFGAGKDIVERVLNLGHVWKETPIEI